MKNQANKQLIEPKENGNVLFIVLITIVLLAALTFAFLKGDSGSNKTTLTKGEAKIAASQIMKYSKSVENAVKKLQVVNECSESEISFENSVVAGYAHASSPADKSCNVFDVNGGGLSWIPPIANDGSDWVFTASNRVTGVGTASADELIVTLPNISENTCIAINKAMKLPTPIPTDPDYFSVTLFTGSYATIAQLESGGDGNSYCIQTTTTGGGTVAGNYFFIKTLIAR